MNRWLVAALTIPFLLAGCVGGYESNNDCQYGGCADYDVNVEISMWDIMGPFLLLTMGMAFVGVMVYVVVKANRDAPVDEEESEDQ